ncbi:MAG TPA: alpha-ketoglutarate-dependent dioxygenase AlkB [Burkholderiales bacterium]|nr:alpha-ketoglutarate-dependent dioxygenase AlkB [Burkholderiales bacterium]
MAITVGQAKLFEPTRPLPHGLVYQPDFLTREEEGGLLAKLVELPFVEAQFQQYTARRRVVRYGEGGYAACYGTEVEKRNPQPIPEFLVPLRRKVALWRGVSETDFAHALCTEYQPGTPIGWHTDAPHFEIVVGISLAGRARMRFRPYAAKTDKKAAIAIELAPRSAYVMQDDIRWRWQHHIPPTKELRYSVTFRTLVKKDP